MNFLLAVLLATAVVSNWPGSSDTEPIKIDRLDTTGSRWHEVSRYFDQPVNADQYLIRPGDRLVVTFIKTKIPALVLFVNPEGKIAHETIGAFDFAGQTLSQTRATLDEALRQVYYADQLSISVLEPREITVSVTGAVGRPGLYKGLTSQYVSEIIEQAGGLLPQASRRRIEFRGGPRPIMVDLDRVAFMGDNSRNPCLYAGLNIHVPPKAEGLIQVIGAVNQPRDLELVPGDDLDVILALAGGVTPMADTASVRIIGKTERPYRPGEDFQDGDIVIVLSRPLSAEQSMISIFGAVMAPGRFDFRQGLTLRDVVNQAGGFTGDAGAERLTLFRKSTAETWQLAGPARYPIANLVENNRDVKDFSLRPADSIFVPYRLGYVKVSGDVSNPGIFPYRQGKDAMHYITAAGGFLPGAAGSTIDRYRSVSKTTVRLNPAGVVYDGDELIVTTAEESSD